MKLPIEEFSASLGLPTTPKIWFLNQKIEVKNGTKTTTTLELDNSSSFEILPEILPTAADNKSDEVKSSEDLLTQGSFCEVKRDLIEIESLAPATRVLKKLKINAHRPVGTRVVFDEDGHALPPLATLADRNNSDSSPRIDVDKIQGRYEMTRQKLEEEDQEDKLQERQLWKEKRMKKKMKWQRERLEKEEDDESLGSVGDEEDTTAAGRSSKKLKLYFVDTDSAADKQDKKSGWDVNPDTISVAEQEALALRLLSSMHS